jgi:hypothetical protein
MARRKGSGLGTVVLVMFLLFFILLSTGLGVSTYLGFADSDAKEKAVAEEKKKTAAMEKDKNWYQFQAELYRTAMGHTQNIKNENLVTQRDQFDKGALPMGPDKDEVKTLITTTLDTKLGWDKATNRWKTNYEELVAAEKKAKEQAEKLSRDSQAQQVKEKKRADDADELLAKTKDEHEKQYKELEQKDAAQLAKLLADNQQLEKEKNDLSAMITAKATANEQDKVLIAKMLKDKDDAIKGLRERVVKSEERIAILKKELGREVPADMRMDWKVVKIDSRGETVYINLGSADQVQPRLTFRVHGIGEDGRPLPKDKALIEVMSVLGDHLSQARINYVTTPRESPRHDPTHSPVLTGDVLINPGWHPNQKTHIAIAGVVDLTGSGHDETEQFVRSLERLNVVVDAYLDLRKDFTIKGPGITVQTEYLILGDKPETILGSGGAARDDEIKKKIAAGMEDMSKQAKENGVRVRSLRQYLEEIGYRVPGNMESRPPTLDVKGEPGALPPPVPKDPMMKDAKPPAPAP